MAINSIVCILIISLYVSQMIKETWEKKINCKTAGWGKIQDGGTGSKVLLKINLTLISPDECKTKIQNFRIQNPDYEGEVLVPINRKWNSSAAVFS